MGHRKPPLRLSAIFFCLVICPEPCNNLDPLLKFLYETPPSECTKPPLLNPGSAPAYIFLIITVSSLDSGDDDYLNETRRKPTTGTRCPTLLISGMGSFICPVAQTRLDIPRPLITKSWTTGGDGGGVCIYMEFAGFERLLTLTSRPGPFSNYQEMAQYAAILIFTECGCSSAHKVPMTSCTYLTYKW